MGVFGVVEGGDALEERVRSAKETAKRPVGGFCLDGLHTGSMEQNLRTQLITAVTKELPEDKPRCVSQLGTPLNVLCLIPTPNPLPHRLTFFSRCCGKIL